MSSSTQINGNSKAIKSMHKKTRVVRGRRRQTGGLDSDEEFVREVGTDSDTGDSSLASDSDSDSPPPSELQTNGMSAVGVSKPVIVDTKDHPDWSELAAAENPAESGTLDSLNFATVKLAPSIPPQHDRRRSKDKAADKNLASPDPITSISSPPTSIDDQVNDPWGPTPSTSRQETSETPQKREFGVTVRQAYQQRLDKDPSYVPTVGQFWSHDDRLLDKDLRSLSGWWRGRWEGNFARGRGSFRGFRGRGRGGSNGYLNHEEFSDANFATQAEQEDKQWTHDGFEEMKKREERFKSDSLSRGLPSTFRGRGRGVYNSPSLSRPSHQQVGRIWYTMKPEKLWTKELDAFLHMDSFSRTRFGSSAGVRVNIPGRGASSQLSEPFATRGSSSHTVLHSDSPPSPLISVLGSEASSQTIVVHLPSAFTSDPVKATEALAHEEPSIDDLFTVRPEVAPKPENFSTAIGPEHSTLLAVDPPSFSAFNEPAGWQAPPRTELQQSPSPNEFVAVPPGIQQFGYSYAPILPPGVAMDHQGTMYEVATGRQVYFPAQPVYAPQPMMQAVFVPSHLRQTSNGTPDYSVPPTPPHPEFVDPAQFGRARGSARIEIRSPSEEPTVSKGPSPRPSTLRPAANSFQPAGNGGAPYSFFGQEVGRYPPPHQDAGLVQYIPYPTQFYYPDPSYAYGMYEPAQVPFEVYGQDVSYQ